MPGSQSLYSLFATHAGTERQWRSAACAKEATTMTDESDPLDWFPHLRTWPDWTPSALWNGGLVPPAPRQVPARLAANWEETPNGGAIAQPSTLWNRGNSHWMESLLPTPPSSGNGGLLGNLGAELDGPPWFNPGPELKSIMPWPAWMRPVVPEALLARSLTQSSTPPMPMSVPASGADGRYGPASTSASAPAASFSDAPDRAGSYSWQSVTAAPSLGASDTIPATPT